MLQATPANGLGLGGCGLCFMALLLLSSCDTAFVPVPFAPGGTEKGARYIDEWDFSMGATYPEGSVDEVKGFYQDYFREQGWEELYTVESPIAVGLGFSLKGVRMARVFIGKYAAGYVSMSLTAYESDTPDVPEDPEARRIARKVADTYAKCRSYRDRGVYARNYPGPQETRILFETRYVAPDAMLSVQ